MKFLMCFELGFTRFRLALFRERRTHFHYRRRDPGGKKEERHEKSSSAGSRRGGYWGCFRGKGRLLKLGSQIKLENHSHL